MRIATQLSFALMTLFFLFISCQKEISYENGLPATGTLKTVSGDCLPSNVNGIFKEGQAVTAAANYIEVDLRVMTGGTYAVSSDTVNGIYFKAQGIFSDTGMHTIRLAASGTPTGDGIFSYRISFGISSCNIRITVVDAATPVASFTCTGATPNGIYKAGTAMNASNTVNLSVNAVSAGTYSVNSAATNGITFSGSGVLTGTGSQVIVLTASGTPVAAGNFSIVPANYSACSFPIVVLPSGTSGAAVFSLGGGGSSCTGFVLGGTYISGTPMTAANTGKIDITVTTAGTYAISSTTVNGVQFSGSGSFSTTGPQQITLTASGTPAAAGLQSFSVTVNSSTCSFPVTFQAPAPPAVFALSGAPGNCTTPVINGAYVSTVPMGSTNTVVIKVNVTTAGAYSIATTVVNGIKFTGAGVFATAGTGIDVTLTGTGTPAVAGTFTYMPLAGSSSCSFNIVTTAAPTGIYTCKIDGVFTSFYDRASASLVDVFGNPALELDGYTAPANGNNLPEFQIFINKNNNTAVTPGTYNVDGYLLPNGYRLEIDYFEDVNFWLWNTSSSIFSPNPPFTVIVTSITANRAKGTFSGRITNLNQGSTQQKVITEGVFDLPVQ